MKKIIGITGGIASGKSTVVNFIKEKRYPVIDADQVVHDLQKKGGLLYVALVQFFGQDIVLENGELNRPKLSELIFSNEANRQASSQLQNEMIRTELARQRDELLETHNLIFMDIPLLFELGYDAWCDETWLIYVTKATQIERLMHRGNYTREEAVQRIASQMPLDDKLPLATHVINNEGAIGDTLAQIAELLK